MNARHFTLLLVSALWSVSGCHQDSASQASPSAAGPISTSSSAQVGASSGQALGAAWCRLSGPSNALLKCPLRLELQGAVSSPAGLQLSVSWDATALSFVGIESSVCPPGDAPCATVMAPPLKVVGSAGHSVATKPLDPSTASGAATVMIYHASNPNALLASELGELVFRSRRSVTDTPVRVSEAVATSVEARSLTVETSQDTLRVGP